ncbi:unnamed protein product [Pleuronectes platessa]|uniref:Uncharacterized protein n=1 Tax=Pleuronectes platessa TaxID=8262 RepID=A0A9N7TX01_PLEPL|nr:unnamed protein product [Pleuronectes platessa]
MNSAVVVVLDRVEKGNSVVETGITQYWYRSDGVPADPPGEPVAAGLAAVSESRGEGEKKAGEEKSIEQDGGDSGRNGGEAGDGRVAWSEQVEEEEIEEEADAIK